MFCFGVTSDYLRDIFNYGADNNFTIWLFSEIIVSQIAVMRNDYHDSFRISFRVA
jgi:hypothetical protein